jgi:hypothetical protein
MHLNEMNYIQKMRMAGAQHRTRNIFQKIAQEKGICPRCMKSTNPEHAKYDWSCKCSEPLEESYLSDENAESVERLHRPEALGILRFLRRKFGGDTMMGDLPGWHSGNDVSKLIMHLSNMIGKDANQLTIKQIQKYYGRLGT